MGALLLTREDGRAGSATSATPSSTCVRTSAAASTRRGWPKFAGKLVDRQAREFYEAGVAEGVQGGPGLLRGAQ